jgi:putative ABC transport system permease protein
MPPFTLVWRNLLRRKLRSLLTVLSLAIAIFLVCDLRTVITTLRLGVEHADPRRLDVLSASGLFVELPLSYQEKLDRIPGVEMSTKFQWFGGYYRSQKDFFAQFAIDPETMFRMYPECVVPPEQLEDLRKTRNGCIIGSSLAKAFGWKIGEQIPLIGALHPHPDDKAWDFKVVGIYHSNNPAFDNRTMWFRWDYFEETLKAGNVPPGVGVFALRVQPGADVARVIADVEDRFRDSEQRIQCATEAEFQRQFQSMMGNIPLFLGWIGGGILIAILVASLNTLLMSMREQTSDVGVMKSLGFTDGAIFRLFLAQAMFLCLLGGGLGLFLAWTTQRPIENALASFFPSFRITRETFQLAALVCVALGPIAGFVPALRARGMRVVEALRGGE